MTAIDAPAIGGRTRHGTAADTVVRLGWREARRMLASPVYALLVGALSIGTVAAALHGTSARENLNETLAVMLAYCGVATLFAASLVATSARRTGAESMFAAAPVDPQLRTLATCLGVLFGPVAFAGLLTVALAAISQTSGPPLPDEIGGWEYAAPALTWLGAGLLGVAVARWLPWPGVPLAVGVGLVAWAMLSYDLVEKGRAAGFLAPHVITSRANTETDAWIWPRSFDAHLGWHAAYLLGLSLLALVAALAWHRPLRQRAVLGAGLAAALLTGTAAWLQLP